VRSIERAVVRVRGNEVSQTWPETRRVTAALDRSRLLLRASVALSRTTTVPDVVAAVRRLVVGVLDPAYVGVALAERGRLRLATAESLPGHVAEQWLRFDRARLVPSAVTVRTGAPVLLRDLGEVAAVTPDALGTFEEMGWQSAAAVPLPGPEGPLGALVFVWKTPNVLDPADQAVLAAIAGYVSHALGRALVLDDRRTAAATLQKALLTPLPSSTDLLMTARYAPAHHEDHVGGDWYDVIRVDGHRLALVIGDVTGHDLAAAAAMSQYRSMLRTLIIDRQEPPSAVLRRLERTVRVLGDTRLASALLAYLEPDGAGGHVLTWSNAGHPAPLLRLTDGAVGPLDGGRPDPLLGAVRQAERRDRVQHLPPGSLLLLYTDGLVETRTAPLDEGTARLRDTLSTRATDAGVEDLADLLIGEGGREDDAVVLLVRTPDVANRS
jgi:Stage II sporulation protein E (SpoIIE)/GAF domain